MSSVDDRIVNMEFNNAAFEKGAATTMSTLDKLKAKLGFEGASAGLQQVEAQANKFDLAHMGSAIDGIASKFSTLSVVAVTALATIVNKAVEAGAQMVKSLTIGPISEGFSDYNLKLSSVKTVMNTTGKSLEVVNGYFKELDTYADKTIFKLSDMTGAFAKFTNAGVSMKDAVPAIKGISNMVALAGQGADAASIAYYNLSQSISGGFLTTTDYKSLNLANVATKEWKQNVIDAAVQAGTLRKTGKDMYVTLTGESEKAMKGADLFNVGLSEQWANAKILTDVLGQYGDQTTKIGKKAQGAAQDVKSLPMMFDTLRAAIGTQWTDTFEILLGNVDESTQLFTGLTNSVQGFLSASGDARNKILGDWKALGGREDLIEGIKNIFEALGKVLAPIKDAFRDIFPPMTGKKLADLTDKFLEFTKHLEVGETTVENLRRTFRGIFAIFDIVKTVVGEVVGVFLDLFGVASGGSGSFLAITAAIGDWLVALDEAIKSGEGLSEFFDGLGAVLKLPIQLLQALAGFIADLFTGVDSADGDRLTDTLNGLGKALTPLQVLGDRVSSIFEGFGRTFQKVADIVEPLASFIGDAIANIGDAIKNSFDGNSFDSTLDAINTGLFAGLVLLFRKFINGGLAGLLGKGGGGIIGTIKGAMKGLTNTLSAMQANLKADTLLKIAGAIALLTVSIVALSLIDSDKLTKALLAISVGFGQLVIAMAILEKVSTGAGFLKLPFITSSLLILAGAMAVLALAVKIFSTMDWEELGKGLTGTAGSLVAIAAGMRLMPNNLPVTAAGLVLVGLGLAGVAGALKIFGTFDWTEIGHGLVAMGGALGVVAAGMNLMPLTLPITAAGLILIGIGLAGVAAAMKGMAQLSWKEMGKGLAGTAGALIIIAGAMNLMPVTLPITAAGLVLVSGALVVLAGALKLMATMSWEEIGKGLATLAGALTILAAGLYAMSGTLLGSAALLVAAGALAVLTPVLVTLGTLSWESIAKGMVALAGSFTVLGLAGLLLGPIIPAILGLAGALALTGAGMALAGAGALAFAGAFAIITATGAAGVAVLAAMLNVIIDAIPAMLKAFAEGIIQFAKVIGTSGPAITTAFVTILNSLLDAVIKVTPKIGRAITTLITTFLKIIRDNFPNIIETGAQMLIKLLKGMRDHVGEIVAVVAQLVVKFLHALGKQLPDIIQAGVDLIVDFLNGLTKAINDNDDILIDAGYDLAGAIIEGMVKGLLEGPKRIASAALNLGKSAIGFLGDAVDAHSPSKEAEKIGKYVVQGFAKGLDGNSAIMQDSFDRMKDEIATLFEDTKAEVEAQQSKLDDLMEKPKKNAEAIAKATKALEEAEKLHERAKNARKAFNKDLKDERDQLSKLGREYDDLTDQLKDAQAQLKQAQDDFKNFAASTSQGVGLGALPDIVASTTDSKGKVTPGTKLQDYLDSVDQQAHDVEVFKASLDTLKQMGLDDDAYQKLLDEGPGIQEFLDQLIAAGPAGVEAVDSVTAHLKTAADSLGLAAALELKQAGIDSAQGLIDGLHEQRAKLVTEMEGLAHIMVKALRKALKIKSPSQVMAEIGKFTNEGLAHGLDKYAYKVDASAANVANTAIDSIRSTLKGVSDQVQTAVNTNPVITPVLDLTQINKDAVQMSQMLDKAAVAQASYGSAASISADQLAAVAAAAEATGVPATETKVELTQNNYSPKAISPVETYRDTKNLLNLAKEALNAT